MPNVPTMVESGYPDFQLVTWFALYGPARLPPEITQRISAAFRDVLADPAVAARLVASGSEPAYGDPAELGAYTRSEIERVKRIVSGAHLTFED
jgi:tripartite-type tricarboxylate transporter receptor subunit TctC